MWPQVIKDLYEEWVGVRVKDLSPPTSPKGSSKPGSIKKKHDKLDSDVDWKCIIEQTEQLPIKRPREDAENSPIHTPLKSPTSPTVNSSGKGLENGILKRTILKKSALLPSPSLASTQTLRSSRDSMS